MAASGSTRSIERRSQFYGSFTRDVSEIDDLLADAPIHLAATAQANEMQQAMFNVGSGNEIAARVADDARADGGRRMVWLDPRYVTIKRRLQGMKMHLSVPVESYLGVVLACDERPEGALYRISLAHRDPELCVTLKETCDRPRILDAWRSWAAFFGVPALVECAADESEIAPALPPPSAPAAARALPRRLTPTAKRGLRRRLRRKTADQARSAIVFRGEREIICYE
jgi:hypothetical protein